jgi:2-C-methyl-D-erythritol 4-phosphate cytidylyltransferase
LNFSLIIPAAGSGSRSGSAIPKQYVDLLGEPVLTHTLRAFAGIPGCRRIVVAIDEGWRDRAELAARNIPGVLFVAGGAERHDSIANALAMIDDDEDIVLVHDAARPCASRELIERVIESAAEHGGAIPAVPINETVKRVGRDGVIIETIPRAELRAAQTPQGFHGGLLRAAYHHAAGLRFAATDDASVVELYGQRVHVVEGEWSNLKITHPEDFRRAEEILRGGGYRG